MNDEQKLLVAGLDAMTRADSQDDPDTPVHEFTSYMAARMIEALVEQAEALQKVAFQSQEAWKEAVRKMGLAVENASYAWQNTQTIDKRRVELETKVRDLSICIRAASTILRNTALLDPAFDNTQRALAVLNDPPLPTPQRMTQ